MEVKGIKVITYLPIGSIVKVKGSDKKLMITGFCVCNVGKDGKKYIYDYIACLWPEGILNTNQNIMFNHNDIAEVVVKGIENEEETAYKTKLDEAIKQILNNNKDFNRGVTAPYKGNNNSINDETNLK